MFKKTLFVFIVFPVIIWAQGQTLRDYRNGYSSPVREHTAPAEPGLWEELHPKIPRTDYIGLAFSDEQTGWATGAGGAIIKTTNAGVTWVKKQSNTTATLTTIGSHNGVDVIAAGFGGTFLYSADRGETWVQKTLPTTANFWNIRFVTERIVWICGEGGNLFRSDDGGASWNSVTTPLGNTAYWDVFFVDSLYGFVGSNGGKLLKTTDGGVSWSVKQSGYAQHIYTVAAPDRNNITVAGAFQKISYSPDGGETWIDHPAGSPPHFNKAVFVNDTLGYLVGTGTGMMRTTDKGASWNYKTSDFSEWNICFPTGDAGYIVGDDMTLKKSTNSGYDWEYMFIYKNITAVQQVSENQIYMFAERLYKSTDKGVTFTKANDLSGIYCMHFIDSLTGYFGMWGNRIMKTTDGGVTWQQKPITGGIDTSSYRTVGTIQFYNSLIGWAYVSGAGLIKTTDGGESWFVPPTTGWGSVIQIFDSLTVFTAGLNLYKTIDGGITWTNLPVTSFGTTHFTFHDTLKGWLTTGNEVLVTTDGGVNWDIQIPSVRFEYFSQIAWLDYQHGFVFGTKTYETRDGGTTWNEITDEVGNKINKFSSIYPHYGYAVGDMGLIVKYIDTSYIPVELHSLSYSYYDSKIILQWQTSSETNNSGFEIERSYDGVLFQKIGFVKGNGTTTEPQHYTFTDTYTTNCFYRLRQIDYNGSASYSNTIEVKENLEVAGLSLVQNFPNPFNPITEIEFALPEQSDITLKVYDILGKEIATLASGSYSAGRYTIPFDGTSHASGVYIYKLSYGEGQTITKKMTLIK